MLFTQPSTSRACSNSLSINNMILSLSIQAECDRWYLIWRGILISAWRPSVPGIHQIGLRVADCSTWLSYKHEYKKHEFMSGITDFILSHQVIMLWSNAPFQLWIQFRKTPHCVSTLDEEFTKASKTGCFKFKIWIKKLICLVYFWYW